eukprot:gene39762-48555_t
MIDVLRFDRFTLFAPPADVTAWTSAVAALSPGGLPVAIVPLDTEARGETANASDYWGDEPYAVLVRPDGRIGWIEPRHLADRATALAAAIADITAMMRAIEIRKLNGHFALAATQRAVPSPGTGDVLIRIRAAGVNGHDVHQIHNGGHPILPGETDLPGLEVSGEIVAIGDGVTRWAVGDAVCALLRGGGYAEYAIAPQGNCLPKPENLGWEEAA